MEAHNAAMFRDTTAVEGNTLKMSREIEAMEGHNETMEAVPKPKSRDRAAEKGHIATMSPSIGSPFRDIATMFPCTVPLSRDFAPVFRHNGLTFRDFKAPSRHNGSL